MYNIIIELDCRGTNNNLYIVLQILYIFAIKRTFKGK